MKIRTGFVSNSSSTAFVFLFKGDKLNDLYETMRKHPSRFEVSLDVSGSYDYETNEMFPVETLSADRVIEAMKNAHVEFENDEYKSLKIVDIDKAIREAQSELRRSKRELDKWKGEHYGENDYRIEYRKESIQEEENHLSWLLRCKEEGFNSVYAIDFGDNHGHIEGVPIGAIMDYHSSEFNFKTDDLCCYTFNKH